MQTRISVTAIASLAAMLIAAPTSAATINWTLSGVVFTDGGTAGGTFSTDSATGFVTVYNVVTTLGSVRSAATYTLANSVIALGDLTSSQFVMNHPDYSTSMFFHFADPLKNVGTNTLLTDSGENSFGAGDNRWITAGVATGALPEPTSWALMLLGFGLVGTSVRRRAGASAVMA